MDGSLYVRLWSIFRELVSSHADPIDTVVTFELVSREIRRQVAFRKPESDVAVPRVQKWELDLYEELTRIRPEEDGGQGLAGVDLLWDRECEKIHAQPREVAERVRAVFGAKVSTFAPRRGAVS